MKKRILVGALVAGFVLSSFLGCSKAPSSPSLPSSMLLGGVFGVTHGVAANKVSDVKIDAGNGTVLTVEAQDSEEKGSETAGEETTKTPDTDTVQEESQVEGVN